MKKSSLTLLTLAGLMTITSFVLASSQRDQQVRGLRTQRPSQGRIQNRSFTRPRSVGLLRMLEARQEELNISDEQLTKIQELKLKQEENWVKQQNARNTQRLEQKKLMLDRENLDYDRLKALMLNNSEIRAEQRIEGMRQRDEIQNVLTTEQKEALQSLGQDRMGQRRGSMRSRVPSRDFRPRHFRRAPEDIPK